MSIETWEKEFAPPFDADTMSDREMLEWCIRKWTGLRLENCDKHGVEKDMLELTEPDTAESYPVTIETCPLCRRYTSGYDDSTCMQCPLVAVSGECCDVDPGGPYLAWSQKGDPEPMIALLEKALAACE